MAGDVSMRRQRDIRCRDYYKTHHMHITPEHFYCDWISKEINTLLKPQAHASVTGKLKSEGKMKVAFHSI